jgi:hypothetical protein
LPAVTHSPSHAARTSLKLGQITRAQVFVPDWPVPVAAATSWVSVHDHSPAEDNTSATDGLVGNRNPPRLSTPTVGRSTMPSSQTML